MFHSRSRVVVGRRHSCQQCRDVAGKSKQNIISFAHGHTQNPLLPTSLLPLPCFLSLSFAHNERSHISNKITLCVHAWILIMHDHASLTQTYSQFCVFFNKQTIRNELYFRYYIRSRHAMHSCAVGNMCRIPTEPSQLNASSRLPGTRGREEGFNVIVLALAATAARPHLFYAQYIDIYFNERAKE